MTHTLHFTKMHGLGNDFMVINNLNRAIDPNTLPITQLANRHLGIGFDQLLMIEPGKQADFYCRIFNADGSEAEQCGNGLRCIARYLQDHHLNTAPTLTLETKAGIYPVSFNNNHLIRITMGAPAIEHSLITVDLPHHQAVPLSILSMGNPHAITLLPTQTTVSLQTLSDEIKNLAYFPHGVNVGFVDCQDKHHLRLRTFERGAGETLACGSNACAAAAAGILNHWLESPVEVEFSHGKLTIEWGGINHPLYMTGSATTVFSGSLTFNA